jgi:hypothetical protein
MTRAYYGPEGSISDDYRLSPVPMVTLSTEFQYANDVIIGYTHTLTLSGHISNYRRLSNQDESNSNPDYYTKNIQKVLEGIELVRKILSRNGSNLEIRDDFGSVMVKAKGGTLRSLNFDETDNNWSTYATYSASIEFNEIEFLGENINCSSSAIDGSSKSSNLINIDNHKIKSFTDGWSFSIAEQGYDYARTIDTGSDIKLHNMVINASYNINATGKNYYIDDKVVPAHEQARIFVQKRLYDKVAQLVTGGNSNLFKITSAVNGTACGSDTLNSIHQDGNGILGNITYLPHNESVNCEISESEGSFSVNYSCILKSKATGMTYSGQSVIHTITKSRSRNAESGTKDNYSISVEGNIQGLYLGGLIYSAGNFSLPSNGSFIIKASDGANKYSSASNFYSSIGTEEDLNDGLKQALNITFAELNINPSGCSGSTLPTTPKPSSFNLTRNYIDGTITYNAEYSSNSACNKEGESFQSVSIDVENPVPVLAEFIVPNGGTIIQDIQTITAKKINITISGRKQKNRECCPDINAMIQDMGCGAVVLPSGVSLPDPNKYVLTQKQRTDNKTEGTYNFSLSYTCLPGCEI